MNKFEKVFLFSSAMVIFSAIPFIAYNFITTYYPFTNSIVEQVIPTNKQVYKPGEAVVFKVDSCYDAVKYSEVNYQIESQEKAGQLDYIGAGSFKSISRSGCFSLNDKNAVIPADFFSRDESTQPGWFRIYITVSDPQNPFKPVKVFKSDWIWINKQ